MKKTTKQPKPPAPPVGLGEAGRRFWCDALAACEVAAIDLHLLELAARQLDVAAASRVERDKSGAFVPGRWGKRTEAPAAALERRATEVFTRLCRELQLTPRSASGGVPAPSGEWVKLTGMKGGDGHPT